MSGDLAPAVELHDAGLASEPWSIAVVAIVWLGSGLGIAWRESRRGHELRHLVPLGIAFGPLLAGFARSSLRVHESTARPVVLRAAEDGSNTRLVLVAVLGAPERVADLRPFLQLVLTDATRVALARPVTFDAARAEGDDPGRARVTRELEHAALFIHDLDPDLVLIPGHGTAAVERFTADRHADLVIVVGDVRPAGRGPVRPAFEVVAGAGGVGDSMR